MSVASPGTAAGVDSGVVCLVLMTQYLRQPADAEVIRHDLGLVEAKAGRDDIVRAAKRLKLKARAIKSSSGRLERLALPAIVEKADGSFAVLAAVSESKVLVHDPQVSGPQELTRAEFEAGWSGRVILVTSRAFAGGFSRRFDFSWFTFSRCLAQTM